MKLFVYGTLLPEFPQHELIRPYIASKAAPGRVRGRLIDAGAYPAFVPERVARREAAAIGLRFAEAEPPSASARSPGASPSPGSMPSSGAVPSLGPMPSSGTVPVAGSAPSGPAARRALGCGTVRGLWFDIEREGLAAADAYEAFYGVEENNDYERIWIADADNGAVQGWIYAWSGTRGRPFAPGDWWPGIVRGRRPATGADG